jgi:hypothetical protein
MMAGAVPLLLAMVTSATPAGAQRRGSSAFAVEAGGASAGSLLATIAAHRALVATRGACGVEDLGCMLRRLPVLGAASIAGATAAGYGAGRLADSRPSLGGSVLGATIGVAAGVGAVKGLDEVGVRGRAVAAIAYALSQGLVTAAGSRLFARD